MLLHHLVEDSATIKTDLSQVKIDVAELRASDKRQNRQITELRRPWQSAIRKVGSAFLLVLAGALSYAASQLTAKLPTNAPPVSSPNTPAASR
jgi:hypothetical protein